MGAILALAVLIASSGILALFAVAVSGLQTLRALRLVRKILHRNHALPRTPNALGRT
jgi:hypothetical protein